MVDHAIGPQLTPAQLLREGSEDLSSAAVCDIVRTAQTLYAGSLGDLLEDVRRRLEGRPYLFVSNVADIVDVTSIIQRLLAYEQQCNVVLAQVMREESL